MADTEKVIMGIESTTTTMMEQLGKAFDELESHRDLSLHNTTQWDDMKEYFQNRERSLKEKFDELEEKEKTFKEKLSRTQVLLAEREAAVAAKERALLDRLQELKDAVVSAVAEARKKCKLEFPRPVEIGGSKENKVRTVSDGDPGTPIPSPEENLPDNRPGESADAVAVEDKPRPQLKLLCKEMDAKGLLKFISEKQKHHVSLRKELTIALKSASEPARLVLDSLEGFYPSDQPASQVSEKDAALQALRRNCLVLMESVAPLLGMTEPGVDYPVSSEIKQQARVVADEWKPKLAAMDLDASDGNSAEAQAFLQLLATFGIASDFDDAELCKLVLAVSRRKQSPDLCRSLGLTHKMPGVVEALVNSGRQLDAIHFAYAFHLAESFPPVPLLKVFLNDLRNSLETTGDIGVQLDAIRHELRALRAVVRCVEDYKLQAEYPLGPLLRRVSDLKKAKADKATPEEAKFYAKRSRLNAGDAPRRPAATADSMQPPPQMMGFLGGGSERYPYAAPHPYGTPTHASYAQPRSNAQRMYHYPDGRVDPPPMYGAGPAAHGNYMGPGLQIGPAARGNYMGPWLQTAPPVTHGNYMGPGLQTAIGNYMGTGFPPGASSNYGAAAGLQSSHQSNV